MLQAGASRNRIIGVLTFVVAMGGAIAVAIGGPGAAAVGAGPSASIDLSLAAWVVGDVDPTITVTRDGTDITGTDCGPTSVEPGDQRDPVVRLQCVGVGAGTYDFVVTGLPGGHTATTSCHDQVNAYVVPPFVNDENAALGYVGCEMLIAPPGIGATDEAWEGFDAFGADDEAVDASTCVGFNVGNPYSFCPLDEGTYRLEAAAPAGYISSVDCTLGVGAGPTVGTGTEVEITATQPHVRCWGGDWWPPLEVYVEAIAFDDLTWLDTVSLWASSEGGSRQPCELERDGTNVLTSGCLGLEPGSYTLTLEDVPVDTVSVENVGCDPVEVAAPPGDTRGANSCAFIVTGPNPGATVPPSIPDTGGEPEPTLPPTGGLPPTGTSTTDTIAVMAAALVTLGLIGVASARRRSSVH
ncbi:hypothetical protein BDK89_2399 [Ilumatobacter fluminis]|uniref:Uncharacterized protein n=1 Tax=Ilumatobacter fluminis TaxID=467091 RepID=A0A4R7I065_9ACTN|nr:hypothetical protein [Ilumatobacter fluminis]TDT16801.1 hypothetical protein BDK89_2399 [Ilumatobacter fluminis]